MPTSLLNAVLITLVLYTFCMGCAPARTVKWKSASECMEKLKTETSGETAAEAKQLLKEDGWNPDAHACLALAGYLQERKHLAFKALREAEETLPKEVMDRIHDLLWEHSPELLAEKEFVDNSTLSGGECLIRNVAAVYGNGFLIIGDFYNPVSLKTVRHIRGFECGSRMEDCKTADLTCPECGLTRPEAVVTVIKHRVEKVIKLVEEMDVSRNLRYIQKVLSLQRPY